MNDPVVYVVDDDQAVRESLRLLLKSTGLSVECYAGADELLDNFDGHRGACIVLDIRMPGMSGLDMQTELARRKVKLPIIFLTGHGDIQMAVQALKSGAHDFFEKPFRDQALIDSINSALKSDRERRDSEASIESIRRRVDSLSPRENEVMLRIVDGASNKLIAADLGLSERTVEIHRSKVMSKMEVRSLAQLVKQVLSAN